MAADIYKFTGVKSAHSSPSRIADYADNLKECIVAGVDDDNEIYLASSLRNAADLVYLLELAKTHLLRPVDEQVTFDFVDSANKPDKKMFETSQVVQIVRQDIQTSTGLKWQPISTAPKDWNEILLCEYEPCYKDNSGNFVNEKYTTYQGYFAPDIGSAGEWITSHGRIVEPTHWMQCLERPEKVK